MILDLNGEIFYWKSSPKRNGGHVNFGSVLNKSYSNILFRKKERKLEEYREKINPKAPSRFKCNYVSPELKGFCDPRSLWRDGGIIYEVQVYGTGYLTDGQIYTNFINCKKNKEYDIALDYWNNFNNYNIRPEIIVDGKVIVRDKVC